MISTQHNPGHSRQLTPHCCWYQREGFVFLTVEVMDCQNPDISVMDDKLLFTCDGGESGKYELDIHLLHDINTKVGHSQPVLPSPYPTDYRRTLATLSEPEWWSSSWRN